MENLKKQIQDALSAFKSGRILEAEHLTKKLIELIYDGNNNNKLPNLIFLLFQK